MNISFTGKFGGWMSIVSGVSLAAAHTTDLVAGGEGTVEGKTLVFLAHLLLVFAFVGIHERLGASNGWLGSLGMPLGIAGTIVVDAIVFAETAAVQGIDVSEVLRSGPNAAISGVGPLLFVLGLVFVGIAIARSRSLPRWAGWSLVVGTVVFALATTAGPAEALVTAIGSALTGLGFVGAGLPMTRGNRK